MSPQIIKNIISVGQFTTDNHYSVEFDPDGYSMKDLASRTEIVRCNSFGPLYPLCLPPAHSLVVKTSSPLWHHYMGHLDHEALSKLASSASCQIEDCSNLCHECQLGRHVQLPFLAYVSHVSCKFNLIHCDWWTSPIASVSGY